MISTRHYLSTAKLVLTILIFALYLFTSVIAPSTISTTPVSHVIPTTLARPSQGLQSGDWAKYDNVVVYWLPSSVSIAPTEPFAYYQKAYSVKLSVIQVNGNILSVNKTASFLNLTSDTQYNTGNVQDTSQPLFPWIIAPNLPASEFNRTMTSQYSGAMRQVSIVNITDTTSNTRVEAVYIWDTITGILVDENLKLTATGPGGTINAGLHIGISETNIWPVTLPEFTVTVPALLALRTGGNLAVTITSLNGYSGRIYIRALVLPDGTLIHNAFNPNTTSLVANQNTTLSMTPTIPSTGSTHILILVGSDTIEHRTVVNIVPYDLTITVSPQDVQAIVGDSTQATIVVNSPSGLRIPVRLSTLPDPTGLTMSISNTQLNGPGLSTLTFRPITTGTYTVNVNVDTPGTHDVIPITVKAVDFRIDPLPPVYVISPPGSTFTARVQITPINGFAKSVSLTAQTSTGLVVRVTPDKITGNGNFTLTLSPSQTGNYTITLAATSGSASHNTVMKVRVLPSLPAASLALPSYGSILVLGIIAGLIIAVASVLTLLLFRKRQRPLSRSSSEPTLLTKPT